MAKWVNDTALDAQLSVVADNATTMHILSAYSLGDSYATVLANSLGSVTLTAGDGNGDYVVADGDADGRKLTVTAQTVAVSTSGTVTHAGLVNTSGTTVYLVTSITSQAVTSPNNVSIPAFDYESSDPA